MKNKRTIIISGIITAVVAIAVFIYFQAKKLIKYDYFFSGISFDDISMNKTSGTVNLRITNPSDITLNVTGIDLKLLLKGVFISNLTLTEPVRIPAQSYFDIPLRFEMEPHKIFSFANIFALKNILDSSSTNVFISGSIKIKKSIFNYSYPVFFNDSISNLV